MILVVIRNKFRAILVPSDLYSHEVITYILLILL